MPTSNQFQMTYATVLIFFAEILQHYIPTQHDSTLFASPALSCVQNYDNKNMFQTVSEITTPFSVGGKACSLFQYSIYARNGNSLVRGQ